MKILGPIPRLWVFESKPKESVEHISVQQPNYTAKAAEPNSLYGLTELQILTAQMLNKKVLLNLIRYCTVFEAEEKKDKDTGLVSISKVSSQGKADNELIFFD